MVAWTGLARVQVRLQNVSKTAAESGDLARSLAEVRPRLTCCAFERIDELACVVALLARSPLENSSPVHPANPRLGIPIGIREGTPGRRLLSDALSPRCNRAPAHQAGGMRLQLPYGSAILAICLDPHSRLRQRRAPRRASRKPLASSASGVSPPTSSSSPTWPGRVFPARLSPDCPDLLDGPGLL